MIERVVENVVSIHFCQTCAFDADAALASEATGFIVDAERGYILTNRVSRPLRPPAPRPRPKLTIYIARSMRGPILGLLHL